ncbi:hypothetical protein Cgig2_028245 [Carnegiea gigantea]|uniref:TLC domain-containing protein n=1 Tax=Carnegiea gigantea TaxID=171969 RepID=A0A9Q1QI36_9CARY|nr:hypothetical protein Cgig2_028245 [Carnegiea gigantea]
MHICKDKSSVDTLHCPGDYGYITVGNNAKLKVEDIRSGFRRGNELKTLELILQGEKDKKNNCRWIDCSVSAGYFVADLGMLLWIYPSLGGIEYVIHHILAEVAVAYAMFSGEGQVYTFMVLISEVTTPEINMRWFLLTIGLKKSNAYIINGFLIFFAWLVARILLFVYLFYHVYLHYDQVLKMHAFGLYLVFVVPSVLAIMNLAWFGKILKSLKKTLSKQQR